jgi:hypothetical protein
MTVVKFSNNGTRAISRLKKFRNYWRKNEKHKINLPVRFKFHFDI